MKMETPSYVAKYSYKVMLFDKVDWHRNKKVYSIT